jgi:hypothetical protein
MQAYLNSFDMCSGTHFLNAETQQVTVGTTMPPWLVINGLRKVLCVCRIVVYRRLKKPRLLVCAKCWDVRTPAVCALCNQP